MTAAAIEAGQGRCAYHVDRIAVGTCVRCGSFYCASCYKDLAGKRICSGCLAIPGIDYLADVRNKAWGKRDGWIWYLGVLFSISYAAIAVQAIAQGNLGQAIAAVAVTAVMVCYFLMLPWSRQLIFAVVPFAAFTAVLQHPQNLAGDARPSAYYLGTIIGRTGILLLFLLLAYRSTRNKLAFKLEVSDAELAKYYDTYVANPAARRACVYGAASIVVPLLIPFALAFGVRGLRRGDPNAWPPTGQRGAALWGLVFTGLSVVIWSVVAVDLGFRNGG